MKSFTPSFSNTPKPATTVKRPVLNFSTLKRSEDANNTILHLGLGPFSRAHEAFYLEALRRLDLPETWSLIGAKFREDTKGILSSLQSQNCVYILETISSKEEYKYMDIHCIEDVKLWTPSLDQLSAAGAEKRCKIISFTVTEGGYYLVEGNQRLNLQHPNINSDLNDNTTTTIYGALFKILKERMHATGDKVTLLSCDNVRSNGSKFKVGMYAFLEAMGDQELFEWVKENTSCPNSMVDRITPKPTAEVNARVLKATGRVDPCAVMAEEFTQWVIEDDFINGRPELEKVGVEFTDDVLPYEEAKIRILNTTHAAISWAGSVRGYKYIHEAMKDESIVNLVQNYVLNDVVACLSPSPINLEKYFYTTMDRFRNAALMDTIERVSADSFSKIPGFILPTIKGMMKKQKSFEATAGILSAFIIFLEQLNNQKVPFLYKDPAYDPVKLKEILSSKDKIAALANEQSLWADLAGNEQLVKELKKAYEKQSQWLQ